MWLHPTGMLHKQTPLHIFVWFALNVKLHVSELSVPGADSVVVLFLTADVMWGD